MSRTKIEKAREALEEAVDFFRMYRMGDFISLPDNAYEYVTEALKEIDGDDWIPVAKRLPESDGSVLGLTEHKEVMIFDYGHINKEWVTWDERSNGIETVTHWMPLPYPPS